MKKLVICGLFAAISVLSIFAQSDSKNQKESEKLILTIEDAVKIASENNTSIRQSKLNLEKLEAADRYSWNSLSPSISASGSYTNPFTEPQSGLTTDSISLSGTVALGLSTNLYTTMKGAHLNYENGLISYEQACRSIELSVRKTFYGLLYEKENIDLQKRGLETSRIQYETNLEKFKNGKISELDVMTSRVRYEQKKPAVESVEIAYENDLASFKQLLGIPQDTKIELSGTLDDAMKIKPVSFENLPKSEKAAPDILSAEKSLEIAKNSLLATRFSAYGPTVSATYNLGTSYAVKNKGDYSNPDYQKEWSDLSHSLTVAVKIPLDGYLPWSQGAASVQNNKKSLESAEMALEDAKTSVQIKTDNYIRKINQGLSQVESLKENEKLAETTYNMSQTAYNYGKTDILSLQNYSDSLLSARVSVKQQAYSLISSVLDLEYLLGVPFGSLSK